VQDERKQTLIESFGLYGNKEVILKEFFSQNFALRILLLSYGFH